MQKTLEFGQFVKRRRKELDLTQQALADELGYSVDTIKKIEAGTLRPSRQLAELLAQALDVPPAERQSFVRSARMPNVPPPDTSWDASPPETAVSTETAVTPLAPRPANGAVVAESLVPADDVTVTPGVNGVRTGSLKPQADQADQIATLQSDQEQQEPANPYKGLRAFQEADAPDFFGREALTQRLLARLAEQTELAHFLAVVGPSGSGKSSVVRAGLVPALRRNGLPGGARPLVVEVTPGTHPFEELEAALLRIAVNPPASLLEQLRADERGLVRAIKRVLPGDSPPNGHSGGSSDVQAELLLVVDQFEELFSLVPDEATRADFLDSLFTAVSEPRGRLWVVVTLRADFYDRPLMYSASSEPVRQRTEVVGLMTHSELHRAITAPAQRAGLVMEPALVSTIMQDVAEQPGALPLLQYALTELYERREGRTLTLEDYEASGGVLGALSRRAEAIYDELDEQERAVARQLFLRLITLGEGVEDTRRRVRRAELASLTTDGPAPANRAPGEAREGYPKSLDRVIEAFGRYRLLTFDRDLITHDSTVEVAHEALIGTWPRLREWLQDSRESLLVQRQLMTASTEWLNSGKDASFLVSGARLAQFEALAEAGGKGPASDSVALTGDERAYLHAGVQQRESARVARERLRRRITIGLAIGLVVTLILAVLAVVQSIQAETSRAEAFSRELAAKSRLQLTKDSNLALLLAVEAARVWPTDEAEGALRQVLVSTQPHAELPYPGGQPVLSAVFSPDGKRVATTSSLEALVWEVNESTGTSGNPVAELETPRLPSARSASQLQRSAAFSPDGKQLLVGSDDGIARVWDIERQSVVVTMTGHTGIITSVAFSPDGKRVATGSSDYTARIWDAGTGKQLWELGGHTASVSSVAFSPDGKLVVTASGDNTAKIWDASTGQTVLTLTGHTAPLNSAMFSPDGKRIVTASNDRTARVWDASAGITLVEITGHGDNVNSAAFSPDGGLLVTGSGDITALGSGDKSAKVWDAYTGSKLADIDVSIVTSTSRSPKGASSEAGIASVTFSPDGKRLLMVTTDYHAAWIYPWELFTPLQQLLPLASALPTRQFTCGERQTYLHETAACRTPTP